MSGKIRVLDAATANQIAAGEVVERPASVVKELVENALDAGSRRIAVELSGGGIEGITVLDDGCGMAPEDVTTAVERHATSKIRGAGDLECVRTLGFRGEALPSIAAVARLEIVTREPEALAGTRLVVRGGEVLEAAETGCPAGTRVSVTELFFNTPARRKHLKSPAVELGHCVHVLSSLALAHPGVACRVRHNGRALLETPGVGSLLEAVTALYGRELAGHLLAVEGEARGVVVGGYAALPVAARGSRSHLQFFVNGRPVVAGALRGAVERAYRGLLPVHRYPVAFLHLTTDPANLDVNIHPSKLQVRFANEGSVVRLVRRVVERALAEANLAPRIVPGWPVKGGPAGETPFPYADRVREAAAPYAAAAAGGAPAVPPSLAQVFWEGSEPGFAAGATVPGDPAGAAAPAGERWPALRVLGQAAQSYIVAEGAEGIYVVDQHAAHERLNFEDFLTRVAEGRAPGQILAVPLSLHLGSREVALWQEHRELLERLGFRAEAFGGDTLLLREVPALFAGQARAAFLAALDFANSQGAVSGDAPDWEYAYAAMAACKASVRARDPLRPVEMEELLARLGAAANPFTCPHGRPTLLRLTLPDLERHFKRT